MNKLVEIKRIIIGSDDDDLTELSIKNLDTTAGVSKLGLINLIQTIEAQSSIFHGKHVTEQLQEFTEEQRDAQCRDDDDPYKIVYQLGYKTYSSHSANGEFNEIVYLVKDL